MLFRIDVCSGFLGQARGKGGGKAVRAIRQHGLPARNLLSSGPAASHRAATVVGSVRGAAGAQGFGEVVNIGKRPSRQPTVGNRCGFQGTTIPPVGRIGSALVTLWPVGARRGRRGQGSISTGRW